MRKPIPAILKLLSFLWLFLLFVLPISACRPNPPIVAVTPSATATRVLPTANPTMVSALTAEATGQATPTETTAVAATTPTTTPCAPPADWIPYRVRAGDTLYSLARLTDTEVADLISANCLESDLLAIDQPLTLPKLPPAPPPAAQVGAQAVACTSLLSCTPDRQVGYLRDVLSPNESPICAASSDAAPTVDATGGGFGTVGGRLYFFACHFADPQAWTVQLTGPDNGQVVLDRARGDNPLLPDALQARVDKGVAQFAFVWPVPCGAAQGVYTLTISANSDPTQTASTSFEVLDLEEPTVRVDPEVGRPGETFEVTYCTLPMQNQTVTFSIFYGFEETATTQQFYFGALVRGETDGEGNGYFPIQSLPSDPVRDYLIRFEREGGLPVDALLALSAGGTR